MAEDTFKHIIWMFLTLLVFASLVYVLLVQLGVISSSTVFDVVSGKTSSDSSITAKNNYYIQVGKVVVYYKGEDPINEETFFVDITVNDELNILTISQWKQLFNGVDDRFKSKVIELLQKQHPLYDSKDIA